MEPRARHSPATGPNPLSFLLLLAVTSSGCAMATAKTVAPPLAVPSAWQQDGSDTQPQPVGDLSRWWETFGDETLSDLVAKALLANPDLRTAQSRLRQARYQRGVAKAGYFPTVTGSASGSTSKTTGVAAGESYAAGLDASWELDVFGATRRAVSAAQADLEASEATLHDTQVSLVAEVALDYLQLRSYQARLSIAKSSLARQEETLDLTKWRAQAGLTSDLDVQQARANLEQTRAQIPSLETARAQAEHALAALLAQPPAALHTLLAADRPLPAIPEKIALGIPADALRQRPDVRVAERQLAAATARVGEAKAARFPSFSLQGSLTSAASTLGDVVGLQSVTRGLVGSLTAPLLNWGRIRNQIKVQNEAQEQALIHYETTVLAALEEGENAIVSLANARRRQVSLAAAAEASRAAAEMARQRYTAGLVSYQTVLDTERTTLSAEDSLESGKADEVSALVRLYKALGGGWTSAPTTAPATETSARRQSEES